MNQLYANYWYPQAKVVIRPRTSHMTRVERGQFSSGLTERGGGLWFLYSHSLTNKTSFFFSSEDIKAFASHAPASFTLHHYYSEILFYFYAS